MVENTKLLLFKSFSLNEHPKYNYWYHIMLFLSSMVIVFYDSGIQRAFYVEFFRFFNFFSFKNVIIKKFSISLTLREVTLFLFKVE